jgi:diguanylate cyclase (GGDEF)-like protein
MIYWASINPNQIRLFPDFNNLSFASLAESVFDAPKKDTIIRLRWLVITVAAYLLLFAQETLLPTDLVHVFILVYIATNASLYPLEPKSFDSLRFLATLVFVDTLALSFALIIAGQLGSDFYLSYFLVIIMAGFWKDFRWSLGFAVVLALFYSFLLLLAESLTTQLLLRVPFVLAASIFYTYFVQLVNNEHVLRKKAEKEARHDFLTGLPNRQSYRERMAQEIDRSIRYGRTLGLLIVDIDNFKLVNDVLGHDWGDIVLQKVAAQLGKTVRSVDFVARIGGEEFVIILPETDITGAVAAANRLLFAIRENPVETTKGLLPVTVSIGVNAGVATDPEDEKRLIADADQALYRAKKSGRDRLATVQDAEEADELLPATAQSA